jgi:uncharacterized membrane protein YphA (DoxX/SURF4 family)
VDRFYSKFPTGSVGLALFLLRLAAGFGLASEGIYLFTRTGTTSEGASVLLLGLVLAASAIMLILGLRTSLAGSAAAVSTAGSALYGMHHVNLTESDVHAWFFLFVLVLVLSSSLALTGPGGYSLDARLSGWRRIRLSPGKTNRPNEWDFLS